MKNILLNHPSRGRPKELVVAFKNFIGMSSHINPIKYVISIDNDDPTFAEYFRAIGECVEYAKPYSNVEIECIPHDNKTVTEAVNRAYTPEHLDNYEIISMISDDFRMPQDWDIAVIKEFDKWGYDKIIKTHQPGGRQDLITIQMAGNLFWKEYGTFFWHEYPSVFSDDDITGWASLNKRIINAPHIVCRHLHPGCNQPDSFKHDATYERENQNINYVIGEQIYNRRKANGFRG